MLLMGVLYYYHIEYNKILPLFMKASEFYNELKDTIRLSELNHVIGIAYAMLNDSTNAMGFYQKT